MNRGLGSGNRIIQFTVWSPPFLSTQFM
jgi:hypothetical protein